MKKNFKLSIITPFYNEGTEHIIDKYFENLISNISKITPDYEIICIDDGSTDNTLELLEKFSKKHSEIKIIKLSRNFGKEAALTAGFDFCSGDCVIPIDADLQDPPYLIEEMVNLWQQGYYVVMPKRIKREESKIKKIFAKIFYVLINSISTISIPNDVGDFRLLDKKVIAEIKQMKEKNRFMKGIISYPGFKTKIIKYVRPARIAGTAKQNYKKLIQLALDGIFSFSILPIRLFLFGGIIIATIALFWSGMIIFNKLYHGNVISGYSSIMVSMLFLNSFTLIGLGILGEYVGRIYEETKNRPIYIIEKTSNL